jgi:hypothetical protein
VSVVVVVRGMLSSSSSLRLAVADIRSSISRRAGGAHTLDVAAGSRTEMKDGFGRVSVFITNDKKYGGNGLMLHS